MLLSRTVFPACGDLCLENTLKWNNFGDRLSEGIVQVELDLLELVSTGWEKTN